MIHNIRIGVKNLIKWFPLVWRDRNWDSYFLFDLLHFKLSLIEEHQRKHAIPFVGQDKIIKQLMVCKNLAKRLSDDAYCLSPECRRLSVIKSKLAVEYEQNVQKNDKQLFFTLMEKHILKWWD